MQSVLDVRSEVIQLINARRAHFHSFRKASNHREDRGTDSGTKHLRQFKTEKWLQAELTHHFWSKQVSATPEYSKEKWDLCIEKPNGEGNFLLAIKCLADSGQHARGDFYGGSAQSANQVGGVSKDLEAVGKHQSGQAALVLILPLDANDPRRTKYTKDMLNYIEQHKTRKTLTMKKDEIRFAPNCDEGVGVVWLEPK